ncbi:protein kinase domain-containing protein [Saccharothrix hoggarensis]|uniref:non-specific serine/threonine protein kinase n=1 Tax=Saccharothrix hoggarensis TaxID=913853 RepID=A0ABW3R0G4_9PSEU
MSERDEVIAGRYRLVALIGRGAAGVVWRARDERLGRTVAVKFLGAGDSPDAVERIVREGRIAARLRHPHAVTVHDVVEHHGKPCLVMEYLSSRTLAQLVDERGPLPEELVAGVGWQVASALAAAHAAGIVHRDVTTFNILLADDGTAKIADFGIARAIGEGTVTDARTLVGTPAFLAPEVAAGEEAVFASDVYSLGATLYAALEGHPPFGATDNPYALLRRVSEAEVEPLRFPGPLGEVLLRVLRRDPAQRPTMVELHALLGAVMEGRSLPGSGPDTDPDNADPDADPHSAGRAHGVPPAHDTQPVTTTRPMDYTQPVGHPIAGTSAFPASPRGPWRRIGLVAGVAVLLAAAVLITVALTGDEPSDTARPAPTTTATSEDPTTTTTAERPTGGTSASACEAALSITNSWPGGYQAEVTVRNDGDRPLTDWTVTWPQPDGHVISNLWNGDYTVTGDSVTVGSADHNSDLPVNGKANFGFTANGPTTPRLDVTCTAGRG